MKILKLLGLDVLFTKLGHLLLYIDGKDAFYVGTRILKIAQFILVVKCNYLIKSNPKGSPVHAIVTRRMPL